MYDWLKKNQKKLLAVVGAFLMVSFLISVPLGSLTSGARPRGNPVAHVGKIAIYGDERKSFEAEWRLLEGAYHINPENGQPIFDQQTGQFILGTASLGRAINEQMKNHPDLFMLLVKEAEARGIDITADAINSAIQNDIRSFSVQPTDRTWRDAIHHLLMVQCLRQQLLSVAKTSEPKFQQILDEHEREVRLNLVEFNAEQLSHATSQPTTQQVQAQFDEYKNILPDGSNRPATDILGFGYEIPNRVKLQYLKLSRADVLKAAEEKHRVAQDKPDRMPYDLTEKAYEYWLEHQSDFVRAAPQTEPATQPATAPAVIAATLPTTQPTTLAATTAPATQPTAVASTQPTGPTTRPFAEVEDEIISKQLKDETDDLEKKIAEAIHDKLTDGWQESKSIHPSTQATTHPTTQPDGYQSYAFLEGVAQSIEREYKVLPEVTQVAEWSDAKVLNSLPGIGSSKTDVATFSDSAMIAAPFATDPAHKSGALQLWQPSAVYADSNDNDYVYRLTDASPAHAPELDAVLAHVREETRLKNAYDLANEKAKKFVAEAAKKTFTRAATDDALQITSTGDFKLSEVENSFEPKIPNFQASAESQQALMEKTKELLTQATPENPTPVTVVPMPSDKLVIVAQLANVSLHIPDYEMFGYHLFLNRSGLSESEKLAQTYFNYDTVVKRIDYKVETQDKSGD